jgi:flagellar basal-body rod protein FlgC
MALFNVFDIAGSGMSAQSLRLNTTASNLANADSASSSTGQTYRARHPVFAAIFDQAQRDGASAGVRVRGIVESQAPLRRAHEPDHPLADADGYVSYPNVSVVEEMANMISASRSYQSNVEVLNTSKQLMLRTLTLGQ